MTDLQRVERFERILRWFRTCAICRSIWPPIDTVCDHCSTELLRRVNRGEMILQTGYPFPVYSLWTWTAENARWVRPLLHALKGGRGYRRAHEFCQILLFERGFKQKPHYVHPPGQNSRDHSWLLAHCFADISGAEGIEVLEDQAPERSRRGQKHRSAIDRAERRFVLGLEGREICTTNQSSWVFVDDVITSGATAMAAYMALGDPSHFEVWTIVCRPKLAVKSSF